MISVRRRKAILILINVLALLLCSWSLAFSIKHESSIMEALKTSSLTHSRVLNDLKIAFVLTLLTNTMLLFCALAEDKLKNLSNPQSKDIKVFGLTLLIPTSISLALQGWCLYAYKDNFSRNIINVHESNIILMACYLIVLLLVIKETIQEKSSNYKIPPQTFPPLVLSVDNNFYEIEELMQKEEVCV